jgi:hypothetical protein
MSPRAPSGGKSSKASAKSSRMSKTPVSGGEARFKSSSGNVRASSMYRPPEWLGRGGSATWTLQTAAQPQHRSGLRRRLLIALIVAALGPVGALSAVAAALLFSSVEQGIRFEAERGLQVARGLFLQQVQDVAAGASALGGDPELLAARASGDPTRARARLGVLSTNTPNALFELTDATGRIAARCSRGSCDEMLTGAGRAGLEPAERSPVILRALDYERTVSVESARDRLVVRAALPLTDAALRLLGSVVVTVPIDWTVVDRLKAALGAGRDVFL